MSSDFPAFSFPLAVKPHQQTREVFGYIGTFRHIQHDTEAGLTQQNLRENVKFSATHPVLLLSRKPETVKFPLEDRIMGRSLQKNKIIKKFIMYLKKRQNLYKAKYCINAKEFIADLQTQAREQKKEPTCAPESLLEVNSKRPDLRELMADYTHVVDEKRMQLANSKYTGGCLGYLGGENDRHFLVSPSGHKFKTINVNRVTEETENLLDCQTVQQFKFPQPVYGIHCNTVQGQGYAVIRGSSTVCLYSLQTDFSDNVLTKINMTKLDNSARSVKLSPYIPGECVVTTPGQCFLWSGDTLDKVLGPLQTRFPVEDTWCSSHFGSHPRQLVYADQTAVQLKDLRTPSSEEIDLFALPSKLLHVTERIRLCEPYPASSFYHLVATDFTLLMMDERFVKHPVLQMDHMLSMPPQYCSTMCQSEPNNNDCMVYVGSQYPADVHGFQLSTRDTTPPQQVTVPWRASKITDLSQWDDFVSQCTNPQMLKQRLDGSLAGVQTIPWKNGHAVYQLNCNGEIFHQVFKPSSEEDQDVTFSAGLGSHDLTPLPAAVTRAQEWISSWEKQLFRIDKRNIECLNADVEDVFGGVRRVQPPDPDCPMCCPDQSPSGSQSAQDCSDEEDGEQACSACGLFLKEGKKLKQETKMSKLSSMVYEVGNFMGGLHDPEELSSTTATTRLLLKQWQKDSDVQELLQERDKEALGVWKAWKEGEKMQKQEAPSLLDKLSSKINVGRSSEKTKDADSSQNDTTEFEEELEMVSETPMIDFQSDSDESSLDYLSDEIESSKSKKKKKEGGKGQGIQKSGVKQTIQKARLEISNDESSDTSDEEKASASGSKTKGNTSVLSPKTKGNTSVLSLKTKGNTSVLSPKTKGNTSVLSPETKGNTSELSPKHSNKSASQSDKHNKSASQTSKHNNTSSQASEAVFKSPIRPVFDRTYSVASDVSLFQSPSRTKSNSISDGNGESSTNQTSDSDDTSVQSHSLFSTPSKKKSDKRKRRESETDGNLTVKSLTPRAQDTPNKTLDMPTPSPKKKLRLSAQKKKVFTAGF